MELARSVHVCSLRRMRTSLKRTGLFCTTANALLCCSLWPLQQHVCILDEVLTKLNHNFSSCSRWIVLLLGNAGCHPHDFWFQRMNCDLTSIYDLTDSATPLRYNQSPLETSPVICSFKDQWILSFYIHVAVFVLSWAQFSVLMLIIQVRPKNCEMWPPFYKGQRAIPKWLPL